MIYFSRQLQEARQSIAYSRKDITEVCEVCYLRVSHLYYC